MKKKSFSIEAFANQIPSSLFSRSGKVFYSGREAFSSSSPLYVLGFNPGGSPTAQRGETVESHTHEVLHALPDDWSAYRDEPWRGAPPGTYGMAPRVLHLFKVLGVSPGSVPCSNLIFARSPREEHIKQEAAALTELCWPFHAFAIENLRPRAILCFGKTAGNYVRAKLGAHTLVSEFVEANNRRWRSEVFAGNGGPKVIVATHPSIADWTAANTDPTLLVKEALELCPTLRCT